MMLTYRYRIYPTKEQRDLLDKMLFGVFLLYNDSLNTHRQYYELIGKNPKYNDILKLWTVVANSDTYHPVQLLPNDTRTRVLKWQEAAYKEFFKWAKRADKGGVKRSPPHMRKLRDTNTIPFRGRTRERLREYHRPGGEPCIHIQGVGEIKTVYHRPVPNDARILWAQLSKDAHGHWYANLQCDFERRELPADMRDGCVGIDVGLKYVIATSDGQTVEAPMYLRERLRELRIAQRKLDRQRRANNPDNFLADGRIKPGPKTWVVSNRMRKTEVQVKNLHAKVREKRRYFWHTVTDYLTREYSHIVLEDLSIAFMQQNNRLSRDVADCAPGMFWEMLKYKAEERGCTLIWVNPAYTSQRCSACGYVAKENRRTQADFRCVACGHEENADVNAARNVLEKGFETAGQDEMDLQGS